MAIPEKPTLTAPPVAPVRGEDRSSFATKANNYIVFIGTNVTDLTEAINWQNTVFTAVEDAASATLINANRADAAAAVASAGVNFQGKWSNASGSASGGGSYEYEGGLWLLLSDVANIAANEPAQGSLWIDVTVYTDSEVDALLGFKANQATTYTETEVDTLLDDKAAIAGGASANFTAMPQVGGDPIVESGSNADGEFTKFSDGTLLCTKAFDITHNSSTFSFAVDLSQTSVSGFRYNIHGSTYSNGGNRISTLRTGNNGRDLNASRLGSISGDFTTTVDIFSWAIVAHGRWK